MNAIDRIAERIVTARDFGADERAAFLDACEDERIAPTRELYWHALERADAIWRDCQRRAGVTNPIRADERARIERWLND